MAAITELFDSKIREVSSPRLGTFKIGGPCQKCLSARNPREMGATAKINNLAFFFCAVDKNQLLAGVDELNGNTFLIKKDGTTPKTSFRAVVNYVNNNIYITTDQDSSEMAGAIQGIVTGVVFTNCFLNNSASGEMGNFRKAVAEELQKNRVSVSFDAFYYDLKNSYAGSEIVMNVAKDDVDIAFAKEGAFSPLKVPEELKPLFGKDFYPFVGKKKATGKEKAPEVKPDKEAEDFMEECRLSKYRLFDVFFADTARIPDLRVLDTYAPSLAFKYNLIRMFKVLCEAFGMNPNGIPTGKKVLYAKDMSLVMNMMFFGPPGTGKSHMCTAIGAALGVPVYQFTVSGGAEEGTFDKMPTYMSNGGITMATQPFRDGYKNGGIIVVDEVNAAKPDVLLSLNGALERPYLLGAGTDEQVERHAAAIVVATCNPGTEGTKLQNTAFYNRFRHWTEFEPTTREQMIKMICAQRKDLDYSNSKVSEPINKILDVYDSIVEGLTKKMSEMSNLTTVLSLRSIIGVVENFFDFGTTLKDAIIESLVSPVQYFVLEGNDEDTRDEFLKNVLTPLLSTLSTAGYQKKFGTGKN